MRDWFDEHGNPSWHDAGPRRPGHDLPAGEPDPAPPTAWDDAERRADLAHGYYEAGQWQRALDELNRALAVRPDQADWRFGLGLTLDALGRFDEAAEAFASVVELRGEDPVALLHLGIEHLRCDQPRRALEALQRAVAADPDFEPAYCQLILAHTMLDDHDRAEVHFYLARQLTDQCPVCFDHLAQSLMIRRDYDRAIWCWHEALRLDPEFPDLGRNLARAYHLAGTPQRALDRYREELRRDPGDIALLLDAADLLRQLGRDDEAGEKLRRVIELEPMQAAALLRLGELAVEGGRLDEAGAHLEAARAAEPAMPGVHLQLALLAEARDQTDDSRAWALRELDRVGQSPRQVVTLAGLLLRLGGAEHAIDLLGPMLAGEDPVLMDEPGAYTAALLTRALSWLRLDRTADAIHDLRRLRRIDPDHATAAAWLIDAYRQNGQRRRAKALLRRARRRFPLDRRFQRRPWRLM